MLDKVKAKIMKDNCFKAVHDKDLERLLKSMDVYDDINLGKYKCLFCGETISLDNIDSIIPYNKTIQFTCDKKECHSKLIGWRK